MKELLRALVDYFNVLSKKKNDYFNVMDYLTNIGETILKF
jgi:hypothetical protein